MATYQGARFVGEQIESLLEQRQLPAELIVADDQSNDGTLDVIRKALRDAPFPIHLYTNPERKGYRRNFIEAASFANAPLIAFCDQDDVWRPDKIARMAAAFGDPEVMLAYHNATVTSRDGTATGRLYGPDGGRKHSESLHTDPWSFSLGFTQVFRRELLAFNPLQPSSRDFLFPLEKLAHDQWFFFLATVFGRVAFLDDDLVAYRQHESNVFSAVDRGRVRRLQVIKATLDHSPSQVASRGASLQAKAAILHAIASDRAQSDDRRMRAAALARHHEDLAALYAQRLDTYGRSLRDKTAAWTRLVARRRRFGARGLSYSVRHAARDLAFGVVLGHLATPPHG